jgi:hypothetical protein
MRKETLSIEFCDEIELEVYDRLEQKVQELQNKLRQKIEKSSKLQSRKDIEKIVAIRALDSFLRPLPAKERLERRTGERFSDFGFSVVVGIDGEYRRDELEAMCLERGLPIGSNRDKKELAWELVKHEFGGLGIAGE